MNIIKRNGRIIEILSDVKNGPMKIIGNVFNDTEDVDLLFRLAEYYQSYTEKVRNEK